MALLFVFVASFCASWAEEVCTVDSASSDACVQELIAEGKRHSGLVKSIVEDIEDCPRWIRSGLFTPILKSVAASIRAFDGISEQVGGPQLMGTGWADDFFINNYVFVVGIILRLYGTRNKDYLQIPTQKDLTREAFRVEDIHAPRWDVDNGGPNFFWFEKYLPRAAMELYVPLSACGLGAFSGLSNAVNFQPVDREWDDTLNSSSENTWDVVLKSGKFSSKADWVTSFYKHLRWWTGEGMWPAQMTDLRNYFKNDEWDDSLENAIAFHLIGTHRVEVSTKVYAGELLPFVIPLNNFSTLQVRPGFGRYGCDLYFDASGLPVLIETPDGRMVQRGDRDWQYWKFVWRSTLVTGITLVDHLHLTHYKTANFYASKLRASFSPDSPTRRFMSIFTFGSIFVNFVAMYELIGPAQTLDRATPFTEFTALSKLVPEILPDIEEWPAIRALTEEDNWQALPEKLKEAPFYADGRLLMHAFMRLAHEYMDIVFPDYCQNGEIVDPEFKDFQSQALYGMSRSHYHFTDEVVHIGWKCGKETADMMAHRLAVFMFVVSAWHRQVGFVGDYYQDPELATMSWKDGEAYGRPKQHMMMSIVAVFTASIQPRLNEDYSHVFKGCKHEEALTKAWQHFLNDLATVKAEIDQRNQKRTIKNVNSDPSIIEVSIAK